VMRDLKLFAIDDDDLKNYLKIAAIHNEEGYHLVRNALSAQYNLSNLEPNIQVYDVAVKGDRALTLRYIPHNRIPLGDSHHEVLKHVHLLWGFDVVLEQDNGDLPSDIIGRCPERRPSP
jgi:stage V sporulation protein R